MLWCPEDPEGCYRPRTVFSVSLAVEPEDDETTILGKDVADLQSGIIVNDSSIEGTLKYVTGYTGYSGDPALQKGNFLALKFEHTEGATTTIQLLGGVGGPVTLDEDMNAVIRITDNRQRLKTTTTLEGTSITKVYDLSMLYLEPND